VSIPKSPRTDKVHPAAELFPMMTDERMAELVEDIKAHGLVKPIELYQDQVIDGRNRLEACKRAGITPDYKDVTSDVDGDPAAYVASANLKRRDLTESQRAAIIAELTALPVGANQHRKEGVSTDTASAPTLDKVAKIAGVGRATAARARAVKKADPALAQKVKAGTITVNSAYKTVKAAAKAKTTKPTPKPNDSLEAGTVRRLLRMDKGARIATFRRLMLACKITPGDLTPNTVRS
jgi:ParB-like chromosome segregation protein Spo0J